MKQVVWPISSGPFRSRVFHLLAFEEELKYCQQMTTFFGLSNSFDLAVFKEIFEKIMEESDGCWKFHIDVAVIFLNEPWNVGYDEHVPDCDDDVQDILELVTADGSTEGTNQKIAVLDSF